MLRYIVFFVVLAIAIYLFDRPIVPEPLERDPSSLASDQRDSARSADLPKCQALRTGDWTSLILATNSA
jgi:hypothetical protein